MKAIPIYMILNFHIICVKGIHDGVYFFILLSLHDGSHEFCMFGKNEKREKDRASARVLVGQGKICENLIYLLIKAYINRMGQ